MSFNKLFIIIIIWRGFISFDLITQLFVKGKSTIKDCHCVIMFFVYAFCIFLSQVLLHWKDYRKVISVDRNSTLSEFLSMVSEAFGLCRNTHGVYLSAEV